MIKAKVIVNINSDKFALFSGDEIVILGKAYNANILPEKWGYIAAYTDTGGNWYSIVADPKLLKIKKSFKDMEEYLPFLDQVETEGL